MEVGRLTVPVGADLGPISKDLEKLRRQLGGATAGLDGVERAVQKTNRATQALGRQLRSVGVILAATFGARQIITTLAGFENSMAAVAAITGATSVELAALRDIAKELGATTEFSASQAADGLKFLGMAGFNAAQSVAAIPAVLDLATAAQLDLARSADITSNIMSGFGIAAENAADVADILAKAASRSNTDVAQLGDAMKYAGPIAASLGIEMSTTAAAVGALSDAGLQGSMAGTGLRQVMSGLIGPTGAAKKAIESMGLTIAEVNPQTNGLVEVIQKLRDRGLDAERALTIFGDRGGNAILALTRDADKVARLAEEFRNVDGAAAQMAGTMRDNLQGDLLNLASAIESLIIGLGESGLTTALRTVIQGATALTRLIAEQTDRIVAYATAITGLVAGWGAYAAAIAIVTQGTALLSAALVLLRANLIRIGIGAVIVLAGELVYWFTQLVERTGGLGNAFALLGDVATGVWEGIVTSAQAIPPRMQAVWLTVQADFIETINQMKAAWNDFLAIFEGPALTMTVGGKTFELIGGLDLSQFKADMNNAGAAVDDFRNRAAELRTEAGNLATEGFDKVTDSLKLLIATGRESQGGRVRHQPGGGPVIPGVPPEVTPFDPSGGGSDKLSKAQREAERLRKAYQDLIQDGNAFIEMQQIEQQAIGMTELEAAKLRATFDLLNDAKRAGIELTPEMTEELTNLAHKMAEAEHATNKLREAYEFSKDVFKGFFTDLVGELRNGASLWEALGNAGANALQKIADKALDMALNGIFDMIFGAFGSGGGFGGFIGKLFGFENGTSFAPGGWSVVGERGPEILKLPAGTQVQANNRVTAPMQASFGNGSGTGGTQRLALDVFVKDNGKLGAIARQEAAGVVEVAIHDYDQALPDRLEDYNRNPRQR